MNEQYPVYLDGIVVAHAVLEQIEGDRATLYIPATRFVMGVKTSLTDIAPEVDQLMVGVDDNSAQADE